MSQVSRTNGTRHVFWVTLKWREVKDRSHVTHSKPNHHGRACRIYGPDLSTTGLAQTNLAIVAYFLITTLYAFYFHGDLKVLPLLP